MPGTATKPALPEAVRSRLARVRSESRDLAWHLPNALHRASRGKLCDLPDLYRADIPTVERRYRDLPGMTSTSERAYWRWHARDRYTGRGAVVDLGSWFGSTTAMLAAGLEANRSPVARSARIHAFDQFLWEPWMDGYADLAQGSYKPGDSFLPEFDATVGRWRSQIDVHAGDLCQETWSHGPIELLLVDAMKNWELTSHIVSAFYPSLLPGTGHVIHQDYGHCFTPWIHLVSFRLRDHFVPAVDVAGSETVVFRVVAPLAGVVSSASFDRASFDDEEIEAAFAYSLGITRPEKHSGIRAAQIVLLLTDGRIDEAGRRLAMLKQRNELSAFHVTAMDNAFRDLSGQAAAES